MSDATQTEHEFTMPVPGVEQQRLKPFEGKFKALVKLWMGPGDPMESTGTMTNEFHLGGLYLHQDYIGDAIDGMFPSFAGKGYWGYNQADKCYQGFWIDNAASMFQTESGQVDSSGKVWTMHSEPTCPGSGQPMKKRTVITLVDDNHHKMESFITMEGTDEMKNMEIIYERI